MEQKKFGTGLKTTGRDVTRERVGAATRTPGRGIRTPLKPANVSDLKAMFDKSDNDPTTVTTTKVETKQGAGITSTQRTTETRTVTRTTRSMQQPEDTGVKVISLSQPKSAPARTTGIKTADEILAKVRAERLNASDPKSTSYVTKHTKTTTVTQTSFDSSDPSSKLVTRTVATSDNLDSQDSRDKAREFLKFNLGRAGSGLSMSSNSSEEDSIRSGRSSPQSNISPRNLHVSNPRGYKSGETSPRAFKPSNEFRSNLGSLDSSSFSQSELTSPRSYMSSSSASLHSSPRKSPSLQRRLELPVSHESEDDSDTVDSSSIATVAKKYGLSSVSTSKTSPTSTKTKTDIKPKVINGSKGGSDKTVVRLTEKKFDLLGSKTVDDSLVKDGEKVIRFEIEQDGVVSGYRDSKKSSEDFKTEKTGYRPPSLEHKNFKNRDSKENLLDTKREEVKVLHEIKVEHVSAKDKNAEKMKEKDNDKEKEKEKETDKNVKTKDKDKVKDKVKDKDKDKEKEKDKAKEKDKTKEKDKVKDKDREKDKDKDKDKDKEKDKDKSGKGLTGWLMGKKSKEEAKEKKRSNSIDKKNDKAKKSDDKNGLKVVKLSSDAESDKTAEVKSEFTSVKKTPPLNDTVNRLSDKACDVKLRKLSEERVGNMFVPPGADKRLVSRNMSSERFEKLKFDFERGCPTEHQDKVTKDAILLPKDLPEVKIAAKVSRTDSFKRKEESIFASGLKVSDFVQQINDSNVKTNVGRTWKKNTARVRSASASRPGENEYHEVSDGASSEGGCYSDGDGIYEFVPERDGENLEIDPSGRPPSRRFGFYKKQKGSNYKKASFKVKTKSNSLPRNKKLQKSSSLEDNSQQRNTKREEEDWETDSNSTTYEPVDDENLYEEAGFESDSDSKSHKKKTKDKDGKTFGEKISSQASNVLNKFTKFGKNRSKGTDSGVSATDSDADVVEESSVSDEIGKSCSLSRSSSERSSGKRARELTTDTKNLRISEDEGMSSPTPPPLPPRASVLLQQPSVENSPPLPPRNSDPRLSLDMVIPVSPNIVSQSTGDLRKKGQFGFGKESYLFGQQMKASSAGDVNDDGPVSVDDSYLEYDPALGKADKKDSKSKNSLKKKKSSSVFRKSSMADDKSVYSSSSSSSYAESDDLDTIIPLSIKNDDNKFYIEPNEEQVYGRLGCTRYSTKFCQEPLYQYYTKEKVKRATLKKCIQSDDDEDDDGKFEDGGCIYEDVGCNEDEHPESIVVEELIQKPRNDFNKGGSLHRALWCEMPEVVRSGVLEKMADRDKKIQEAMFEIITSEASYLKSLNIVINVFLMSPEFSSDHSDRCVVTKRERTVLFSNIGAIRDTSERFLADLEKRWQESYILKDICDIINEHASKHFQVYVRYCSNQKFQTQVLDGLKKKSEYVEAVRRLESHPQCQNLPMSSFLLLPMQRITRLPLLVDAICHRLEPDTPLHKSASQALETLNKIVKSCNEGAKKMQQTEEMCLIANQLDFNKVKEFPIRSASRYLVKKGDLVRVINDTGSRMPFGKKGASKQNVSMFLFNDLMILTKKKGNQYVVTNYCQRNSIHVESIDNVEKCPHLPLGIPSGCKNLFLMVMLENNEDKQLEMVLSCNSPSDRTRWIDAVTSSKDTSDADRVYEEWDCPQVQCIKKYVARESDELSLEVADVVNVLKKSKDGMFEGERIHDGERGWFPVDHTEEIVNSHVRARNLKIRYRLLIKASEEYKDSRLFHIS
ncbi:hypothetical protein SNE40_015072 [Patella caerulea]|uniref:Uncharacterized protein n=1 Tax=Patella caerulea TaxID=87958 RepID=A0AAN8JEY2_PATCE